MTLADRVKFAAMYNCRKHNLSPDCEQFVTAEVNRMSVSELLDAISWELQEAGIMIDD